MNDSSTTQELIFRRLQEDFSLLVLGLPVFFALAVVFLIVFYRQQESLTGLLRTLFIPPAVVFTLSLAWGLWLVVFAVLGITFGLRGVAMDPAFYLFSLLPLVGYPLLLGLLATIVLCAREPRRLIPFTVVAVIAGVYLVMGSIFKPTLSWWVVLVPVLLVALVYVGLMYRQDAQTIHPTWASLLGIMRCCVYAVLAFLFLLPGCQSFDIKMTYPKILVLFDISESMNRRDDLPKKGQKLEDLPTRQEKVIAALVDTEMLSELQALCPTTAYRFGARLDTHQPVQFLGEAGAPDTKPGAWVIPSGGKMTAEQLREWLIPGENLLQNINLPDKVDGKELSEKEKEDRLFKLKTLYDDFTSATNVSNAALQALLQERGSNLQAIVVFSDGQSNIGSSDALYQLMTHAANPKKQTHIITVCVGDYHQPTSIRIEDIQAPVTAHPDDNFYVQVPVYGDGLADEPFDVQLDIQQVVKQEDKWVPKAGGIQNTLFGKGKFKAKGQHAFDKVRFEIDVTQMVKDHIKAKFPDGISQKAKDALLTGYWQFTARVPRHEKEHFTQGEHVSTPAQVLVQKRKIRVLLFAGGPTREYQFLRNLLYREVQESRLELSIFLQTGTEANVFQDVEPERLLTAFPNTLGQENRPSKYKYYDLNMYDVIIAIDPDWTTLNNTQLRNVEDWVGKTWAGGLIFVAGPIYSYQMARDSQSLGKDLSPIKNILPVKLRDSRLAGFGIGLDSTRPYPLEFTGYAKSYEFMQLAEDENKPFEGWNDFFWEGEKPPPGKIVVPSYGFYSYYPVKEISKGAKVLATFQRPLSEEAGFGDELKEPPFIAVRTVGSGKTAYLGSGEFWRLRQVDEDYHQRFWIKLLRFAGSGNQNQLNDYGQILMLQKSAAGSVSVEAQLLQKSKKPIPQDFVPVVNVKSLDGAGKVDEKAFPKSFKLEPRLVGDWTGWFQGTFPVYAPGRYRLSIPIPDTNEELDHVITIYQLDPEKDNPRPNHDHLYEMSTSLAPVLSQITDEKLEEKLRAVLTKNKKISEQKKQDILNEGKDDVRLCFDLSNLDMVSLCLTKEEPSKDEIKGGLSYLLDRGWDSGVRFRADHLIMGLAGGIGLLVFAILLFTRRFLGAVAVLIGSLLVIGVVLLMNAAGPPAWEYFPLDISFVLMIVVGLLCLEWLSRKLLRLA